MNFVQTTFLIGSAAIAIPVVVHMLSRLQVRRIELGTMRFLHEVLQEGAHRRKIRRWFLLFTRALLMLLLSLLFARPFIAEPAKRGSERLKIIMIDRSASMGMQGNDGRLLDDAVAAAIKRMPDPDSEVDVLWAWFDSHVQPMSPQTLRPIAPDVALGSTSYSAALRWARDRLDASVGVSTEVVLVTDLQKAGFAALALEDSVLGFPADVPVEVVDVGRPVANNLAIVSAAPIATQLKPHHDVNIGVTLFNYGALPFDEVPITATASNGQKTVRRKKSVDVPNGEAEETSFSFGQLEPGLWQVTIAVDAEDDLLSDNHRFTAVSVADPVGVLVLDSGEATDGANAESYFVIAALQENQVNDPQEPGEKQETSGRFQADVVFLNDDPDREFHASEHPLVVVPNAGGLSESWIQRLGNYVNEGGELLVFAGKDTHLAARFWQDAGLAPGKISAAQRGGVMPFRIDSISPTQSMMAPFQDPQHADLSRLAFRRILPVEVDASTDVLAWFDQSRPAITQHQQGPGRVVWFLSSGDSSWSNWTTSPLYLPLVQQMAADLLDLTGEGPVRFRSIGDDDLAKQQIADIPGRTYIPVSSQSSQSTPKEAGMSVVFNQPGFVQRSEALYVVNGSATESDPARAEVSVFVEHFGLSLPNAPDPNAKSTVADRRHEYWPWLAAALVVLVMAEFSLSNRTMA